MMYNELFKMLEERSHHDLQTYWKRISRLQESILGPYIERSGLQGMYDYWAHIIEEENCEAEMSITDEYFEFRMLRCPSLSKNLDNDAGLFELYCDHCAGWVEPLLQKYGYHLVYDMISRSEPVCVMRVYRESGRAKKFAAGARLLAQPYHNEEQP